MRTPPLRIDPPTDERTDKDLSRVDALAQACRQAMQRVRHGEHIRLPPVRQMAAQWGLSCDTVVRAYEQLAATGWIESRQGSGYYVKHNRPGTSPTSLAQDMAGSDNVQRLDFLSRQLSIVKPDFAAKSRSGCGSLPASWLQHDRLATKLRELGRKSANWSDYPDPQGFLPLRQFIAQHLAALGINAGADQVLITSGASEALQLAMNVFFRRSEGPVLYENPCSPMLGDLMMSMGLTCEMVNRTQDGPDLQQFESLCSSISPQAFVFSGVLHNPTGTSLTEHHARQLARLAQQHELLLIEDDTYGDLAESGLPRLSSRMGLAQCLYISSFSKTISPALRCGYVVGTPERIRWLTIFRMVHSLGGSLLSERVLSSLLRDGGYGRHCERLRNLLSRNRPVAVDLVESAGLRVAAGGEGMYLWARLPDGLDATTLAVDLASRGHVLAPGALFSPLPEWHGHLRFNVAETAHQAALARDLRRAVQQATQG